MRNLLLVLSLIWLASLGGIAKQSPGNETANPFANKTAVALYPETKLTLPFTQASVLQYLQNTLPALAAEGISMQLSTHKTSPGGEHFTFETTYYGTLIFNSQVKVNIGHNGTVYSIFDNSYPTANWPAYLVDAATAIGATPATDFIAQYTGYREADITERTVFAVIDNQPAAYKLLQLYHAQTGDHKLYLVNKEGIIVYVHDLNAYASVPATAYVFKPDPLTTAQTVYLAPYVDSNDANTQVLRNERVLVNIMVDLTGGIYSLENDHFVMADFSAPSQTVTTSLTPSFLFTRADSAFEEVNAYYHLTTYQAYVASLGYTALTDERIQVDAHALNGSDNSQFSFGGGFPRLFFGDGGVDDAEDADVVIHEYGHALSYAGSPGTNFGQERTAIDEGFGDYFAASYSRSISPYRWDSVFSWDGHNQYWAGRNASTDKIYPTDLGSSIHRNGEMWATALMEVWTALGQEKADKLALQTLFALASNMSFTDVALAYIQADAAIYGGAHYNIIYPIMVNRGFLGGNSIETLGTPITPAFQLSNTWGFTFNGEAAVLKNTTGQPMTVNVIDISGKTINTLVNLQGDVFYLSGEQLVPGTYILQVVAGKHVQQFKLLK